MDVITGGKFLLGIGLGYRPEEYDMFGVQMAERASRLAEGVEIIRRLWGGDRDTHCGRHWQFSDATIRPRQLQSPSPPIIIGAQVDAAIRRAAKIGDGWLAMPILTLDQQAVQISLFNSTRVAAMLPPSQHMCRLIEVGCAADDAATASVRFERATTRGQGPKKRRLRAAQLAPGPRRSFRLYRTRLRRTSMQR
jgi:alkanesulfonate monooxygenase SsuD/methylene tetrahydromethanopterin reductase-like flavin-dependent oxidoreductase (luciferase family)